MEKPLPSSASKSSTFKPAAANKLLKLPPIKFSHPSPKLLARKFPKISTKFLVTLTLLLALAIVTPFAIFATIAHQYASRTYSQADQLPQVHTALVLGASVYTDGSPSPILADRVRAAVELYKKQKVQKLLMSGDNRSTNYNEPEGMKKLAEDLGVPAQDIQADYAGRRTYDSCWRAKNIFSQDKIIIVTQSFHMTRALFLCNQLGIDSIGYTSDQPSYTFLQWSYWQLRDIISLDLSLVNIYVKDPSVVKGEKISL